MEYILLLVFEDRSDNFGLLYYFSLHKTLGTLSHHIIIYKLQKFQMSREN